MKILSYYKGRKAFWCLMLFSAPSLHPPANAADLAATTYFQQATAISGTVSDASGTLPGVSVSVKGKPGAAITDGNGSYIIEASQGEVLIFSFIGYASQKMQIGTGTTINILLRQDSSTLEEVTVNAGYYKVKDKERTGSIARITAKEIERQPVSNPLAALQGRMAGVSITQQTGVAGGGFDIKIRGRNSLREDGNAPLYIIDGVPYASDNQGDSNTSQNILPLGGGSPLNGINPSDIESMEILKDADATAIYGSRGANGVVLITTKKAKKGRTQLTINSYTAISRVTRFQKLMDTQQYLAMRREAFANDGFTSFPDYAYDVNGRWDQERYTDWQKELIGGNAITRSTDIGLSGGNGNTNFLVRASRYMEGTVFPGSFEFGKSALHLNANHESEDKRTRANVSINYVTTRNDLPGNDLTRTAAVLPPNAPSLFDAAGELNWEGSTWQNPLAALGQNYRSATANLTIGGSVSYRLLPSLEFTAMMGYADSSLEEKLQTPHTVNNPAWGYTSAISTSRLNNGTQSSWSIEPQLNFKHDIGKGSLEMLAGLTFQERVAGTLALQGVGFSNNSLMDNLTAASALFVTADNSSTYRYNSLFGRINYKLSDKYIVNLTGRRDGSSRFGPGNRFANFGAVGAAWIFSQEKLAERLPFLSFGKLRASYGITGSDQIGDYQFLDTYNSTGIPYQGVVGLQPARLSNPSFGWETNKKLEAAMEAGAFGDRLFLTVAHYRNQSSGQLVGLPLPRTTGFASIQANLGATVQNTGWEFEVRGVPIATSDWNWTCSVNLSLLRNKLLEFPGLEDSTYADQYMVGQSIDILKLYNYTGIDPDTGLYSFEDYNNDGEISWPDDAGKIVNLNPEFFGGLHNSLTYKSWELDFLFQFVKQQGYNYAFTGTIPGILGNQAVEIGNGGQPSGTGNVQLYTAGSNNEAIDSFYRYIYSSGVLSDASFVRLKNLSLSYTVPAIWNRSLSCKVYFQGQNLLTLTKFRGPDPENQTRGNLPPLRVLSVGVQFTL